MSRRQVPLLVILLVGCAWIANAFQRPVAAYQPTPPQRQFWEYKSIIEIAKGDIAVAESGLLNQAGAVGWELVSVIDGPEPRAKQYILKRPKPATE